MLLAGVVAADASQAKLVPGDSASSSTPTSSPGSKRAHNSASHAAGRSKVSLGYPLPLGKHPGSAGVCPTHKIASQLAASACPIWKRGASGLWCGHPLAPRATS